MMNISNRKSINLKRKSVTVIGLGRSGLGAATLAHHLGAKVFASDAGTSNSIQNNLTAIKSLGMDGESGEHSAKIYDADLWVISPGIPQNAQIIQHALNRNIPIVGEIELASWFTDAPIVAVTGSNGKTTTVHALVNMCQSEEIDGVLAGNMGVPFSEKVLENLQSPAPKRVFILEISSFQMEFIRHFKPYISVFLNISPDHLDRYKTMDDYVSAKMNLTRNQSVDDFIIFNADDTFLASRFKLHGSVKVPFSLRKKQGTLFGVNKTKIYDSEQVKLIDLKKITLPGRHNLANLLAAATAARLLGIPKRRIAEVMSTFKGIAHRLESVTTIRGVGFINDSKATNIDSVIVALESFSQPIILILGGKDKGGDFKKLLPHTKNVKAILAYGQARETIESTLRDAVRLITINNLKEAVSISQTLANPGELVMLSPGCASFDQFNNFEERGNKFKEWVHKLEINEQNLA